MAFLSRQRIFSLENYEDVCSSLTAGDICITILLKAGEGLPFNQNISKGQLLGLTISKADKKLNGSCLVIQQKTNLLSQKQHRRTLQHPQKSYLTLNL